MSAARGAGDARAAALARAIAVAEPGATLRLNANRSTLLSLRRAPDGWRVSVHIALLDRAEAVAEIPDWVRRRGRGAWPGIEGAMRAVIAALAQSPAAREREAAIRAEVAALPRLASPLDLHGLFDRVHATWFAHLPKPPVAWARQGPRRQRHIRFGCYRRGRPPLISLHPKLDQPWVAWCFVEHVLFHELCHHAQACAPVRGESAHSARFRAWERRYPLHAAAQRWERAYLRHLLDGTTPPDEATATADARAQGGCGA